MLASWLGDRLGIVGNAQHTTVRTRRGMRPSVPLFVAPSFYPWSKAGLKRSGSRYHDYRQTMIRAFHNKDSYQASGILCGEMIKQVCSPEKNQPNGGGVGKTYTRKVPARAPACLDFNSDALARRPQHMQSTDTLYFGHVIGADGTPWRRRVHKDPPLLTTTWEGGGYASAIRLTLCILPFLTGIPPSFDRKYTSCW